MRTRGAAHEASNPTISIHEHSNRKRGMGLIVLEALVAGDILVLIVWWTMFSGRDKGELKDTEREDKTP